MNSDLDYQILLHFSRSLEEERLLEMEEVLADSLDEYMRFREIREVGKEEKGRKSLDKEWVKKSWRQYARISGNRFDSLTEKYFRRYHTYMKDKGKKGTVTELNSYLSGHNKWYRMLKQHGIGPQYGRDMRRLCILFRLSYGEATEFLWSAGHPLDSDSRSDYVIAECLVNKIYETEQVDRCLAEVNEPPLFGDR